MILDRSSSKVITLLGLLLFCTASLAQSTTTTTSTVECGDGHCFNGGSCVSQQFPDGTTTEYCDCTTARTSETAFAGLSCQHKATTFCTELPDHNGRQFCANGGSCRADSHLGCECLEGFSGPVCEFRDSDATDISECTLECQNNGVCRKGAKDVGFLMKFKNELPKIDTQYSNSFEHCVCPKGFTGLQCEHMVEVCPGGEHICMHGSECVADDSDGRLRYRCDCDSIRLPFEQYTGPMCNQKSSEICSYNGRPGTGLNKDAFCVNGGKCRGYANEHQSHPGCDCPPEFEGKQCEKLSGVIESKKDKTETGENNENNGGLSTGDIVMIVVFVDLFILLGIVAFMHVRRRQREREESGKEYDSASYPGHFEPPRGNDDDHDLTEPPTLENILAMQSLSDNSGRSMNDDSVCSRAQHNTSSITGDGTFKVEATSQDLVNISII